MEKTKWDRHYALFAKRVVLVLAFSVVLAVSAAFIATGAGAGSTAFAADGGWQTVETAHFYIHFHPGYEKIAARAAAIAEDVHKTLSAELGYNPKDKTHLTLTDTTDLANGFSNPVFYRKIQIYLVYPAASYSYDSGFDTRSESWLRMVITHEYTHALHMDMNDGLARAIRTVFGNVPLLSTPNATASSAFIEGLAVYRETAHTSGGRGQGAYYDMFLRAATLGGRLPRLDQVLGFYDLDGWWPAGTPYLYGWSLMDFIARKYGEDKLAVIAREYSKLYRLGIGGAVKKVLGKTLFTVWGEWRNDLAGRYAEQAERIKAAPGGITQPKNLTTDGELHDNLAFSPDGRFIAFAGDGKKHFPGLYLLDRVSGKERKLDSGLVAMSNGLSWFPDGQRLVYAKIDNIDSEKNASDLYVYDLRTRHDAQLTHGLRADGPAVSPDGTKLAFVARDKENGLETRLIIADIGAIGAAAGTVSVPKDAAARLATAIAKKSVAAWAPSDETQVETPAWSPDGKTLALGVWRKGGFQDIALFDVENRSVSYLTEDRATDRRPVWSPDGKYIVFESDRGGVPNLFAYEVAGGRVVQLTNVLYGAAGATLPSEAQAESRNSGNGQNAAADSQVEMAFMNYGPNGYDIAVMPFAPAGRPEVALTREKVPVLADAADAPAFTAAKTGAEALAAAGLKARPYNPWPSLAPRFWLPSIGQDERGWEFGFLTAGADAVGERSYTADVRFGPNALRPAYALSYQQTLAGALRPTVSLQVSDQSEISAASVGNDIVPVWRRTQLQAVGVTVPVSKVFSGHSLSAGIVRRSATVYDQNVFGAGQPTVPSDIVYAGWTYQNVGGSGKSSRSVSFGSDLALLFREPSLAQIGYGGLIGTGWGQLRLGTANEKGRRNSFSLTAAAGASTMNYGVYVGGGDSQFGVRGYGVGEREGSRALKLGAQYTAVLAGIDRGYGDWPVFLGKLKATAFAEGGVAWSDTALPNLGQDEPIASVGAELTLNTYLGYSIPLQVGVGIAKPLTKGGMAIYPVIGSSF